VIYIFDMRTDLLFGIAKCVPNLLPGDFWDAINMEQNDGTKKKFESLPKGPGIS